MVAIYNFFSNIKQSWLENIKYLSKWHNIKNMLLLLAQTINVEKYYLTILILIYAFINILALKFLPKNLSDLIIGAANSLSILLTCAIIRPSLNKKNLSYFISFLPSLIPFMILRFLFVSFLPVYVYLPILLLMTLFLLDSKQRFTTLVLSALKGILMYLYNFPALMFLTIIYDILRKGYVFAFSQIISIFKPTIYTLIFLNLTGYIVIIIIAILITNFYKMRLHEQYSLYFYEPK